MKSPSIAAVDVFCGAGGLTLGLREAGIKVIRGIDTDESVRDTYTFNNPGAVFLNKDIREVTASEILEGIDRSKELFLLAGK